MPQGNPKNLFGAGLPSSVSIGEKVRSSEEHFHEERVLVPVAFISAMLSYVAFRYWLGGRRFLKMRTPEAYEWYMHLSSVLTCLAIV